VLIWAPNTVRHSMCLITIGTYPNPFQHLMDTWNMLDDLFTWLNLCLKELTWLSIKWSLRINLTFTFFNGIQMDITFIYPRIPSLSFTKTQILPVVRFSNSVYEMTYALILLKYTKHLRKQSKTNNYMLCVY
jgi:hypothetical protein